MKKIMRLLLIAIAIVTITSCHESKDVNDEKPVEEVVEAEKVELDEQSVSIEVGKSLQLTENVLPVKTTNKKCSWFSDDETLAKVDESGLITAIKEGKVNITVATSNNITAICNVNVIAKPILVESVEMIKTSLHLKVGSSETLYVNIIPSNATNKNLSWKSSKESIVGVTKSGLVSGLKVGSSVITVTTEDGAKTASCTITVEKVEQDAECKDKDGRVYKTVKIGDQIWMSENLAYLTAEMISQTAYVYDYTGSDLAEAKELDNYKNYGVLYTFEEAEKCIPEGWHLPTDAEWKELEMFIGFSQEEADSNGTRGDYSYKLMGKDLWIDSAFEITNETGFSALPSGYRSSGGSFSQITKRTVFWGARYDTDKSKGRALFNDRPKINRSDARLASGYCVRCIKD